MSIIDKSINTNLAVLCGFAEWFCVVLADDLSCEEHHATMDIGYRDEPPSRT